MIRDTTLATAVDMVKVDTVPRQQEEEGEEGTDPFPWTTAAVEFVVIEELGLPEILTQNTRDM